jgi:CRISPR-associated exonuclease Cas4
MLPAGIGLLIISLILFLLYLLRSKASGMPWGKIIYSDTRGWGKLEKPLFDSDLGLTGKPDYLVEKNGKVIPVEVKSGKVGEAPYDSHIYQLAAYCLLIQRVMGKRPPYGILHYANRTFEIEYTQEMETQIIDLIIEMRNCLGQEEPDRSHQSPGRCRGCGYRSSCSQVLKS